MSEKKEKEGLGGWLILVGIGLIFAPIKQIALFNLYKEIFSNGTWEALTKASSDSYTPLSNVLVSFELIGNCVFLIAFICLIFLFFKKKRNFPKFFIITILANLAFFLVDILFTKVVFPAERVFDQETSRDVIGQIVYCAIWVPYMLKSVRVRNTFVK